MCAANRQRIIKAAASSQWACSSSTVAEGHNGDQQGLGDAAWEARTSKS